jgi:osmotically inducible lipoprotein OsmB
MRVLAFAAVSLLLAVTGCTHTQQTVTGAAAGGVTGAVVAGPIGAAVGAGAGAVAAPIWAH